MAYLPVPQPAHRGKGRPKIYGTKVRLKNLAQDDSALVCAPSPVYGERDVTVRYRVLNLMWRPVGHIVRFYSDVAGVISICTKPQTPIAKPFAASCAPTTSMSSPDASLRACCSTCPSITPQRFGAAFVAGYAL